MRILLIYSIRMLWPLSHLPSQPMQLPSRISIIQRCLSDLWGLNQTPQHSITQNIADQTCVLIVWVMQLPSRISTMIKTTTVRDAYSHHGVWIEVLCWNLSHIMAIWMRFLDSYLKTVQTLFISLYHWCGKFPYQLEWFLLFIKSPSFARYILENNHFQWLN